MFPGGVGNTFGNKENFASLINTAAFALQLDRYGRLPQPRRLRSQ
jgi:hypothetical protein